jgi:hypothetical protein
MKVNTKLKKGLFNPNGGQAWMAKLKTPKGM